MHVGTGFLVLLLPIFGVWWLLNVVFLPPGRLRKDQHGRPYKMPPGPKGVLLFGNLLQFARLPKLSNRSFKNQMLNFAAQYGEMTTLHLGSKTWVLLNSDRVAREIINKRSAATNERSDMPISSGIVSRNSRSLLMHTKEWMEPRRVYHQLMNGSALAQYAEWQTIESIQMMAEYLLRPQKWYRHHYRFSNSVVLRISLGVRWLISTDELKELQDINTSFIRGIGKSLVDFFPQLDKLPRPLQFLWRPYHERIGNWHNRVYRKWWDPMMDDIAKGTAPPSYVRDVLKNPEHRYQGTDEEGMYVAMQLIGAGSNTTRESMNVFVMSAISNPDVFAKARSEVDKVCTAEDGTLRLPELSDMQELSYISAYIKELLRWRPIFPMVPDHTLSQDMEFEGYYFPKGTGFIINAVATCAEFEDPEDFKPERWLDGEEHDITKGKHWQFGGGRRVCSGYKIAQGNIFLSVSRLLYCFDFTPAGKFDPLVLRQNATNEPFPVSVKVRSEQHKELILAAAEKAGVLKEAEIDT